MTAVRLCRLAPALCVAAAAATAACAPARLTLPTDAGSPLPDIAAVHAQASRACRGVRTLTAELSLVGRAGRTRLRGRVVAGFERPASMRLEGVAPFGPPAFILAARGGEATLLLPRDERVLSGASPDAVLGALTGVALAPGDLLAILTGCVVPEPVQREGRVHGNGWASIDLEGDAKLYLVRVSGAWQPRAAARPGWDVQYGNWQGDFPRSVTLRSLASAAAGASAGASTAAGGSLSPGAIDVDLTATVSQIEANVPIDPAAFSVVVPTGAARLTLDELRDVGPLRGEK